MSWILGRARDLRFPYLFGLTAVVFVLDLLVPDALPFADELLLALLTMLFGSWRKRRKEPPQVTDGAGDPPPTQPS